VFFLDWVSSLLFGNRLYFFGCEYINYFFGVWVIFFPCIVLYYALIVFFLLVMCVIVSTRFFFSSGF